MEAAPPDTLFMEVLQAQVCFTGRVQGVGFRQQTYSVATEFDVAGWVRNLPDGRVELLVEGAPRQVENFLRTLDNRLSGYIRKTDRIDRTAPPSLSGFQIR